LKDDLGRSKNRGCNNGRIFVSTKIPQYQINKDMWINPNALDTLYVKKSSDTSRASTIILTDDPHLSITLPSSGIFSIDAYLLVTGNSSGDINTQWSLSGVSVLSARSPCMGMSIASTDGLNCSLNTFASSVGSQNAFGTYSTTYPNSIFVHLLVESNSSGGSVTLKWAQASSHATPTVLESDSYMIIRQLAGSVSLLKWYSETDDEWKFMI